MDRRSSNAGSNATATTICADAALSGLFYGVTYFSWYAVRTFLMQHRTALVARGCTDLITVTRELVLVFSL